VVVLSCIACAVVAATWTAQRSRSETSWVPPTEGELTWATVEAMPATGSEGDATPSPTSTEVWTTPGPGWPRPKTELNDPEEVAAYVHKLLGTDIEWSAYYVKLTTYDDIEFMMHGRELLSTPDLSGTPEIPSEGARWIVGYRSPDLIDPVRILGVMGMGRLAAEEGWTGGVYCGFAILDTAGWVVGAGTVDNKTLDGTPVPNGEWEIEDIEELRTIYGDRWR